jgi:excisionase family DNA binding protein
MLEELIDTNELARILKLRPQTLRGYVSARKIPFIKLGAAVRFTPEQVKEIVEKGKREALR